MPGTWSDFVHHLVEKNTVTLLDLVSFFIIDNTVQKRIALDLPHVF